MTVFHAILRALGVEEPQKEPVDIALMLDDKAARADQTLDWRHSVVDLMKLLDVDSSEQARVKLAEDLRYRGEMGGPHMNEWLRQQLMHKIMDNGGVVPGDLL